MNGITITAEQAKVIEEAVDMVPIRDPSGNLVAYAKAIFTKAEIEKARRGFESDQPRYTTQQVLDHLRSLAPE